jgi:hypothetical protein
MQIYAKTRLKSFQVPQHFHDGLSPQGGEDVRSQSHAYRRYEPLSCHHLEKPNQQKRHSHEITRNAAARLGQTRLQRAKLSCIDDLAPTVLAESYVPIRCRALQGILGVGREPGKSKHHGGAFLRAAKKA